MLKMEVHITGLNEQVARLRGLNVALLNNTVALAAAGKAVALYFSNDVFATQGGALGVTWPTLATSTIKQKAKHFPQYQGTPLIRTGKMKSMDSFKIEASPTEVKITNTAPYFKYHQSSAPRTKLPRRQVMGVNEQVRVIVREVVAADIKTKVEVA
jgi:hypothetical protein